MAAGKSVMDFGMRNGKDADDDYDVKVYWQHGSLCGAGYLVIE